MRGAIRSVTKTLTLLAVLGHFMAIALAASPSLHCWLHGDHAGSDHACAAVSLLTGQLDQPLSLAPNVAPPAIAAGAPFLVDPHFPAILRDDAMPARAPPLVA